MMTATMPNGWTYHRSIEDDSVNFTRPGADGVGVEEARLVHRGGGELTVYLSAQTGCAQACRMCWLTSSKQGRAADVTPQRIFEQARVVIDHVPHVLDDGGRSIRVVNFAFMARGEPLASGEFTRNASAIFAGLTTLAQRVKCLSRIKVSTVLPLEARGMDLAQRLGRDVQPDLYWSMYSARDDFRQRWLPNALPVDESLAMLRAWQDVTHKIPRVHFAIIAGENDSPLAFCAAVAAIRASRLRVDFNLVRYNPPTPDHGVEGDVDLWAKWLRDEFSDSDVEVVSRVGPDVAASCGMFVGRDLVPLRAPTPVRCTGYYDDGVMPTRCTATGGCQRAGCPDIAPRHTAR